MQKSMVLCTALFTAFLSSCATGAAASSESTYKDSEGKTAWLYSTSLKGGAAARGEPCWLVVAVHGLGGDGKGAVGVAHWAGEADDVLVLGPTFDTEPPGKNDVAYQTGGGRHEKKLKALIQQVAKDWKIHPKVYLHGFSGGAQFVHRFAFRNPDLVAGVSAHSAGTWAGLGKGDRINPAAKDVPFVVTCGEADDAKSFPGAKFNRIDGSKRFAEDLRSLHFDVDYRRWPKVGHWYSPEADQAAKEGLAKVKAKAKEKEKTQGADGR